MPAQRAFQGLWISSTRPVQSKPVFDRSPTRFHAPPSSFHLCSLSHPPRPLPVFCFPALASRTPLASPLVVLSRHRCSSIPPGKEPPRLYLPSPPKRAILVAILPSWPNSYVLRSSAPPSRSPAGTPSCNLLGWGPLDSSGMPTSGSSGATCLGLTHSRESTVRQRIN